MRKNTEIRLVGQPIFGQLLKLIDSNDFNELVREYSSDRYYKSFKTWDHLVTMLFGILSRCDSMAETCEGLQGMVGKLNHLKLIKPPAKSSAGDGLRNRKAAFFEALYYQLVRRYETFLSVSRSEGLSIKELYIVDSTTIRLFSDILKGVGRNPAGDGRKKGGIKVHMLIDACSSTARFVRITEAKTHDQKFMADIDVPAHSMLVFDKAYNDYGQFTRWTEEDIYFVTRQKSNAQYEVEELLPTAKGTKDTARVTKEEIIMVDSKVDGIEKSILLRRVCYQDEKNRKYIFISNNLEIPATEIALVYRKRWGIELLFKKMKQNFQLNYFYGENENAIRTQVWCTLIAQLLLTVLQHNAKVNKAFSTVATIIRIHLISMLDVCELLSINRKSILESAIKKKEKIPDLFNYMKIYPGPV